MRQAIATTRLAENISDGKVGLQLQFPGKCDDAADCLAQPHGHEVASDGQIKADKSAFHGDSGYASSACNCYFYIVLDRFTIRSTGFARTL